MYFITFQILLWTIKPYIQREAFKSQNDAHSRLILHLGQVVLNIPSIMHQGFSLPNKWMLLAILNTFFSSYIYNILILTNNVSAYVPVIHPTIIILTVLIDALFYKINIPPRKFIGLLCIIIGIGLYSVEFKNTEFKNTEFKNIEFKNNTEMNTEIKINI
jgi:drug/metabolite transporter (DMT)-like permease